jgi:hypothetical protein
MTIALITIAAVTALAAFLVARSAKRNPNRDWHAENGAEL